MNKCDWFMSVQKLANWYFRWCNLLRPGFGAVSSEGWWPPEKENLKKPVILAFQMWLWRRLVHFAVLPMLTNANAALDRFCLQDVAGIGSAKTEALEIVECLMAPARQGCAYSEEFIEWLTHCGRNSSKYIIYSSNNRHSSSKNVSNVI